MSSDQDRQREKLITLLRAQFPRATKEDVIYAADDLIASVETVVKAAGGIAYWRGGGRTFITLPDREVATDEQR